MLLFNVNGQTLTRTDKFNPATDSVEYLKAQFTFTGSDWSGKGKTALFRVGDLTYPSVLNSGNTCVVPWEALVGNDNLPYQMHGHNMHVSLMGESGTVRITTNEIAVKLAASGYGDMATPADPTETVYQQILTNYGEALAQTEAARAELASARNTFANAIKGNLSGAVVTADDVSPVEHKPVVKVRSKNLFLCMVAGKTTTMAGVTFTYNVDGSVKLQGTATSSSNFSAGEVYLDDGVYYLCDFAAGDFPDNFQARIQIYSESTGKSIATLNNFTSTMVGGGDSFLDAGWYQCRIRIEGGHTYNCTLYPTLFKAEPPTEYIPNVSDLTLATVDCCGKNLFKVVPTTVSGVTISKKDDYFVLNGTATASNNFVVSIGHLPAGTYTLSANNPRHNGLDWSLVDVYSADPYSIIAVKDNASDGKTTAQLADSAEYLCRIRIENGKTYGNFIIKPQLEVGDVASNYEAYVEPTTHTPAADGTVEGITSLSPNMTILTDTEGVIVECEYTRDTNKVIDKIITALGGTV